MAVLTMDKPPLNLVHLDDIVEMARQLGAPARRTRRCGPIVLTGTGGAFIGGADIPSSRRSTR